MRTLLAAVALCAFVCAPHARAQGTKRAPSEGGSLFPKPGAPDPKPFTLADRYLDAARRADLEMVKNCIEKGVEPDATDGFRRSALLLAIRDGRDLEMAKYLQSRGLAIDDPDVRGITPLGYAAGHGDVESIEWLLEEGAAADRKDAQGQTPLTHAVLGGHPAAVERLLALKVDVDNQDRFGDTPLMGACSKGLVHIAKLLVEAGADVSLEDQEGRTARDRAAQTATYCRGLVPGNSPD